MVGGVAYTARQAGLWDLLLLGLAFVGYLSLLVWVLIRISRE